MLESIENIIECVAHLIRNSSEWRYTQEKEGNTYKVEINGKLEVPFLYDDCCEPEEVDELDFSD